MIAEEKQPHEMSGPEHRAYCSKLMGLPLPPDGAPKEEIYQWYVAGMFLTTCRVMRDPCAGKVRAANFLLADEKLMPDVQLIPLIERALGRPLTPTEMASRAIEAP
jgi:hypothetical protein